MIQSAFFSLLCFSVSAFAQKTIELVDTGSVDYHVSNFWSRVPATMSFDRGVLSFAISNKTVWASSEAHDWGSWAADGSPNPDNDTVLVNRALVLMPDGCRWESLGGYAVLAAEQGSAASVLAAGSRVAMTFPDGTSWSWAAGSSVTVPALPQSIMLEGTDSDEKVVIYYEGSDADPEYALYSCPTYFGTFAAVTNAIWTQLANGTRKVEVPTAGAGSGFFRASVARNISPHFQFTAPVVLSGGLKLYGDDLNGILYDSIITITNDTGVYLLPAQKVE